MNMGRCFSAPFSLIYTVGTNIFYNNKLIEKFNELRLFTKVKSLVNGVFADCSNLSEIDLENITTIQGNSGTGRDGCAFYNTKIKELYLPNLTNTGWITFNYNRGKLAPIDKITIGNKLTTVGIHAFAYTYGAHIKLLTTQPPNMAVNNTVLSTTSRNGAFLYVPDEAVDTYKANSNFVNWVPYIKPISECPW